MTAPQLWRPQFYPITVPVKTDLDSIGRGSFKIKNSKFLCKQISHQIIGASLDFDEANVAIKQDGQYSVRFMDERETWQADEMLPDAAFGSVRTGRWIPLFAPIAFAGSQTIQLNVQNLIDRTPAGVDLFNVHFVFFGVEELPTT
jgi:hypothetical protein